MSRGKSHARSHWRLCFLSSRSLLPFLISFRIPNSEFGLPLRLDLLDDELVQVHGADAPPVRSDYHAQIGPFLPEKGRAVGRPRPPGHHRR